MPVTRLSDFDTWRPGYAGATLTVFKAASSDLADLFLNEALTVAASNPQTLLTLIEDDVSYGKLTAPVYVAEAFQINIDSIDTTGIIRPALTTLEAQDASLATVLPDGAVTPHTLGEITARMVNVLDYGEFIATGEPGASSATNTTTLETAIGAVAAAGAGEVHIPAGVFDFVDFTIPDAVVLVGAGKTATFLQSTFAGNAVRLGGDRAGFRALTFDGVSQVVGSVGVYMVGIDETQIDRALIKRFETGYSARGGQRGRWFDFSVSDCITGAKLLGDLNSGSGSNGADYRGNLWDGGVVDFCTTAGIDLERKDKVCGFNRIKGITFDQNTGTALKLVGVRSFDSEDCIFEGNTTNISINDGTPVDTFNTIADIVIRGGRISGGAITLSNTLENVLFDRVEMAGITITLNTPKNNVLARDCREDSAVVIAGTSTAWIRSTTNDQGASFGLTTGNAATKTWAITLVSGQMVLLEAKVIGRQRNGAARATYWFANTGRRAPATLAYDTQTLNFTAGNILTGGTSGATARIISDADGGTTGTLSLQDVKGVFVDNEIITDGAGGSATANGAITEGAVTVGTLNALRTAEETDASWDAAFVANGPEIELRVTGASAQTVEWTVEVEVTTT